VTAERVTIVSITIAVEAGSKLDEGLAAGETWPWGGKRWRPVRVGIAKTGAKVWVLELAPAGEQPS
jgi:hypothetical protein